LVSYTEFVTDGSVRPNLREEKKRQTRATLVQAAVELFESNGFDHTTVDDIVDRVRFSPSTFFRHFGSKEDVVFGDLPQRMERVEAELRRPAAIADPLGVARDVLTRETAGLVEFLPDLEARCIRLWFVEPALQRRHFEHVQRLENAIAESLAQKWHTTVDADARCRLAGAAMIGVSRAAVSLRPLEPRAVRDALVQGFDHVMHGLSLLDQFDPERLSTTSRT
jgi:AcrR family transcriptional regulator